MRVYAVILLIVVVVALGAAGWYSGSRPTVLADVSGKVAWVKAGPFGVLWLEHPPAGAEGRCRLVRVSSPGEPPAILAEAADIPAADILTAPASGAEARVVFIERHESGAGELKAVGVSGTEPHVIARGLKGPASVAADGHRILVAEVLPSRLKAVPFVPAAGVLNVIKEFPTEGGTPAVVAVMEGWGDEFQGKLLRSWGTKQCWLHHSDPAVGEVWSTVYTATGTPWRPKRRVTQMGIQRALILADRLYYTTPSDEFQRPLGASAVKLKTEPAATPVDLTDWLPGQGWLVSDGRRLYYHGYDGLWLVPDRLGFPRLVAEQAASLGAPDVYGGSCYCVVGVLSFGPGQGKSPGGPGGTEAPRPRLIRQPMQPVSWLRKLLGRF